MMVAFTGQSWAIGNAVDVPSCGIHPRVGLYSSGAEYSRGYSDSLSWQSHRHVPKAGFRTYSRRSMMRVKPFREVNVNRTGGTCPVSAFTRTSARITAKLLTSEHFFYIVCLMPGRDYLGEFEHIVILALMRLSDQAYGVTVRQEIEVRTGREVSIGAIYATLGRLETKGYVHSYLGDPTPERGGRSKRFFRVTAKGVTAVNRTHRALHSMTEGLRLAGRYSQ
jgi:PadR family transcriptional regulator PadR